MQPASGSGYRPVVAASDHHRLGERRGVDDAEQLVDVDRLDREAAADDVVAGAHQLDAGAVQVGVEVAGREVDRLARLEHDVVEQQGGDDAGVARVRLGQARTQLRLGAVARRTAATVGCGIELPAVERLDRGGPRPSARASLASPSAPISSSSAERRIDRPDAAQRLELGERAEQLRLGVGVGVDASCDSRRRPVDVVGWACSDSGSAAASTFSRYGRSPVDSLECACRRSTSCGPFGCVPSHSSAHGSTGRRPHRAARG